MNARIATLLTGLAGLLCLSGCLTRTLPPPKTVPFVDLDRYLGRWYVIANIPYFLENGKVASYDTYSRRADGMLGNVFTFRKKDFTSPEESWNGTAQVVNAQTNAEWKVSFIWPLKTTYLVIELDPDYRWAVVATPGHDLLWVLARERSLSDETYAGILARIAAQGYDPSRVKRVPQPAS